MLKCNHPDKKFHKCVVCMTIAESMGGLIACEIAGKVGYTEKDVLTNCEFAEKVKIKKEK